ncbi:hypothetical protein B0T19DRAFT_462770 [Cercophora scortea]|uniref:Uncharacterized protein n=1 Tax=Cercophora scortea TaxID=314031 RepID=A0AAE0M8D5_9PEZI|nr:hypothetical protein B0T19DRAFT_462770 [Cercophora scortea]
MDLIIFYYGEGLEDVEMSEVQPPVAQTGVDQAESTQETKIADVISATPADDTTTCLPWCPWIARAPPPRFPLPQPPTPLSLQLQTQASQLAQSSASRGMNSYFSPVAESPASSRTSTTSGIFNGGPGYPFPKTTTPQPGWGPEDSNLMSLSPHSCLRCLANNMSTALHHFPARIANDFA